MSDDPNEMILIRRGMLEQDRKHAQLYRLIRDVLPIDQLEELTRGSESGDDWDRVLSGELPHGAQPSDGALTNEGAEPVAWMYKREGGEILGQLVQMESDDLKDIRLGKFYDNGMRYIWPREDYIEWIPLYRHPAAPASVALPERKQWGGLRPTAENLKTDGWNAYDDEFKRLNPGIEP